MFKGKCGLSKFSGASVTIFEIIKGRESTEKITRSGMKLLSTSVAGGTTTGTFIDFYVAGAVVKTLTSSSGAISDTTPLIIGQDSINKIVLRTTGDHSSAGLTWLLSMEY